jgi:Alpha-amylase C-terminal beta-sheet domain
MHAERNLYVAEVDDALLLKLGAAKYEPGEEWKPIKSGHHWSIWERADSTGDNTKTQ